MRGSTALSFLGAVLSFAANDMEFAVADNPYMITVFQNRCIRSDDNMELPGWTYSGPSPGSGKKFCLVDRNNLLLCSSMETIPSDLTESVDCPDTDDYLRLCPALKGVSYGLQCDELSENDDYSGQVPATGNWLCITKDEEIEGCTSLKTSGKISFFTGGSSSSSSSEDRRLQAVDDAGSDEETDPTGPSGKKQKNKAQFLSPDNKGEKKGNEEEFISVQTKGENDFWFGCYFKDGRMEGCETFDNSPSRYPQPYWMFSGFSLVENRRNLFFMKGWITVTGLEVALANTIEYFTTFFTLF